MAKDQVLWFPLGRDELPKFTLQDETMYFRARRSPDGAQIQSAFHKIQLEVQKLTEILSRMSPPAGRGQQFTIRTIDRRNPCAVGSDLSQPYTLDISDGTWFRPLAATIAAKTAPAGDDLICDYLYSTDEGTTWASLFPSGDANKIVLPDGEVVATITTFAQPVMSVKKFTRIRYDVLQVGSGTAGGDLDVVLYGNLQPA